MQFLHKYVHVKLDNFFILFIKLYFRSYPRLTLKFRGLDSMYKKINLTNRYFASAEHITGSIVILIFFRHRPDKFPPGTPSTTSITAVKTAREPTTDASND